MTNKEIIATEAITNNIYTQEELEQIAVTGDLGLYTYGEWRKAGYQVRKGEKAKITTYLWRKSKKPEYEETEDGKVKKNNRFYLCKAYLFTRDQVEKMEEN